MRAFIQLGDGTSHGGQVISASGPQVYGKPIALVGDNVSCPIDGHGVNRILSGETRIHIGDRLAALNGFKTECGCTLIASLSSAGENS
ncbi:PAAR domain-containing protein [Xenorhabdus sp. 42]|uniref:PAAR domain-containing protein n=1 Tax=Xenorhabdus szentirmaii TaxID=290112 RepID=UPI0019B10CA9|nr:MULTISPECIES: PAAR domain-containing protein [unclassified Xenorhabdus]MBD2782748.1 PAAR domain-containing protein [Xenorhabdus sp. 38]MBD2805567.1 PAAR domain-containing protein [Xenorhabdus sp. ZM]MBD2821643.1 PAAR domain-containing protein [Xenorhabdus sp. 42]MBD2823936.1 PAAR domain-containing protein [Xenorhabdus sp. 5]